LEALTQIGRVTISLLLINDPEAVAVRKALQEEGTFGV
jgi:phosphoribosylformylglycinamidine (FGAM) synthase PurS component